MRKIYLSLLLFAVVNVLNAQDVIFSETFDGGFGDWNAMEVQGNMNASSNWVHTTTGPAGSYAADPIMSTTSANGWVLFDSDLNCSQANQEALLISPALDASGKEQVFVTFETYYRSFNDRPSLEVSIDINDPTAWVSFEVFPGVEANAFGGEGENPQTVSIDITNVAAGEAQFWIAFRFLSDDTTQNGGNLTGCAYSWQIDDVEVTAADPRPANDMRISQGFFAIAPNAVTPASQVAPFGFLADVENIGSEVQPSADLAISIVDLNTEEEVFTDNSPYDEIGVDSLIENQLFPNLFEPAAAIAAYQGTYTLTPANGDERPDDNTRTFEFAVSDSTFAKALQATRLIAPAGDNSYAYGNCYYVPNGAGQYARFMSFSVGNAEELVGLSVSIFLYKWDGDLNEDFQANADEYGSAIGFNSYTFDGSETQELLTIPVSVEEEGVPLEDDAYYLIVTQFDAPDAETNLFLLGSDSDNYNAAWFTSTLNGTPQYASVLDVGNTGDFSVVGFGWDLVPIMQLHIGSSADLTTSTVELLSEDNKVALYPNPTADFVRLDLGLVNAQDVQVEVFSAMGQRVFAQNLTQIQKRSLNLDVSEFPVGAYFVVVRAEDGTRTLKLSVNR